ncbi:flagellin, partial [Oscillospiraceae bacterium 50-16]
RAQITGLNAAQKNVKDGTSLVKTAEGAMQEIHDMLNRMDYLATQSANGTYDNEVDRLNLQKEVQSLKDEINRIADSANFNGIKLLDGTQSSMNLSAEGVTYSTKSTVEGLTVNDGVDGGGTKGVAEIDVSNLFGTGDTLAVEFTDSTLGTKTLTYGTDIKGATKEEQAESIKAALEKDAGISQKFDIAVDGSKVSITAKAEGASEAAVKSVKVNDKGVTFGTGTYTAGTANAAAAKADKGGFTKLFDGGVTGATPADSLDVKAGDVLTFTFKDAQNNENLVAKVTVTDDMIGATNAETTENIVNALKDTKFENKDGTVADESRFKVSDLFDLTANKQVANGTTDETGSIYVKAKLDGQFDISKVERSNADDSSRDKTVTATACATAGTANVASKYEIVRTDDTTNFSSGDVIELTGSLSDGRNFNLKLTVGKDFQVGASYAATLANMKTQLEKTGDDATMITLNDGSQVKAGDIFGTGKEITIGTSAATGITFTSAKAGPVQAGIGGGITNVTFSGSAPAEVAATITKGTDPSAAESSFTFSKGVGYGTAITVGGKTYELVKDARDVTNRSNEAVVVDDLTDLDAVASKFADAINGVANKNLNADGSVPYTATADGTTVKITTSEVGSDVKAMEITTPYGDEVPTVSFKFDPDKIQAGSYMTISDGKTTNTYEFVKTGEKPKSGNTAIEISDFNKMPDAKALGDAFANVVKGATVEVGDDGTVTITANEVDGSIPKLNVSFYEGKGGLKLQIGDTSEEYNQLKVSVGDMHTVAMGIEGIDISNQDGAAAAIDVIKNAINYVSGVRGDLGAIQNRLDHTANNLSVMAENIQDAESAIR